MAEAPPDHPDDASLADDAALATELVRQAGVLAARIRTEGLDVSRKTSGSDVVTQADLEAEHLIVERLAAERPDDAVVGEEGTARPGTSGRTWVIDPVDGTYNFSRGSDWWCSAIALTRDGSGAAARGAVDDVLLGAVHHEPSARTWVGGPRLRSTLDGAPLAPLPDTAREARCAATYLHPPFYEGAVGGAFARALTQVGTLRMLGSGTLDLMAVATGQLDVLFQHSVPPWDMLPGAAVIRGAGGATRVVRAAGVEWYVAGAPRAVADVVTALLPDVGATPTGD